MINRKTQGSFLNLNTLFAVLDTFINKLTINVTLVSSGFFTSYFFQDNVSKVAAYSFLFWASEVFFILAKIYYGLFIDCEKVDKRWESIQCTWMLLWTTLITYYAPSYQQAGWLSSLVYVVLIALKGYCMGIAYPRTYLAATRHAKNNFALTALMLNCSNSLGALVLFSLIKPNFTARNSLVVVAAACAVVLVIKLLLVPYIDMYKEDSQKDNYPQNWQTKVTEVSKHLSGSLDFMLPISAAIQVSTFMSTKWWLEYVVLNKLLAANQATQIVAQSLIFIPVLKAALGTCSAALPNPSSWMILTAVLNVFAIPLCYLLTLKKQYLAGILLAQIPICIFQLHNVIFFDEQLKLKKISNAATALLFNLTLVCTSALNSLPSLMVYNLNFGLLGGVTVAILFSVVALIRINATHSVTILKK